MPFPFILAYFDASKSSTTAFYFPNVIPFSFGNGKLFGKTRFRFDIDIHRGWTDDPSGFPPFFTFSVYFSSPVNARSNAWLSYSAMCTDILFGGCHRNNACQNHCFNFNCACAWLFDVYLSKYLYSKLPISRGIEWHGYRG